MKSEMGSHFHGVDKMETQNNNSTQTMDASKTTSAGPLEKALDYHFTYSPQGDDVDKVSLNAFVHEFGDRTSMIGIAHVSQAPSGMKKLFWLVLTVVAFSIMISHLTMLVAQYTKYPVTTEVENVLESTKEFPGTCHISSRLVGFTINRSRLPFDGAVSICNMNGHKQSPESIEKWNLEEKDLEADFQMMDATPHYEELDDHELHHIEDLVVSAKFASRRISLHDFELFVNPQFGNCYTFNKNSSWSSRMARPGYGLELLLNIESYAYTWMPGELQTDVFAAVIKIHHPDITPTPEESSVLVFPGTFNRVLLYKTTSNKLGGKFGECITRDAENPHYSKQSCEDKCLQEAVMNECCCYIRRLGYKPQLNQTWPACGKVLLPCNNTVTECWHQLWMDYEADRGSIKCEHCIASCSWSSFSNSVQTGPWPRENRIRDIHRELVNLDYFNRSDIRRYYPTSDSKFNLSYSDIRANLVKVQIYYGSMATLTINEHAEINDYEFVSELGGALGLWAGWTVMTLFEFVEFLADLLVLYKVRRKERHTAPLEQSSSKS